MSNSYFKLDCKTPACENIKKIILGLIIVLILGLIIYFLYYLIKPFLPSEQFINYQNYQILKKFNHKDKASSLLSNIDQNINEIINAFNTKYSNISDLNVCNEQKKLLDTVKRKLNKTYKSNSLQENFPTVVGKDVSYNINKGEVISICLRNYNNPDEFHEFNDLLFVTIHEIAHSCNESYGHDRKFWKIFRILLEVAVENNLYKNINYQRESTNYCSMKITYNPIFDRSLDDIEYFK